MPACSLTCIPKDVISGDVQAKGACHADGLAWRLPVGLPALLAHHLQHAALRERTALLHTTAMTSHSSWCAHVE